MKVQQLAARLDEAHPVPSVGCEPRKHLPPNDRLNVILNWFEELKHRVPPRIIMVEGFFEELKERRRGR